MSSTQPQAATWTGSIPQHVWEASALLHAGFGVNPDMTTLEHWVTAANDAFTDMPQLGQMMIDYYAPGISPEALVTRLYQNLTGTTPDAATVQHYASEVGPGQQFPTEGALLAYAATLSQNLDGMAGFMGVVQQSEPQWFA